MRGEIPGAIETAHPIGKNYMGATYCCGRRSYWTGDDISQRLCVGTDRNKVQAARRGGRWTLLRGKTNQQSHTLVVCVNLLAVRVYHIDGRMKIEPLISYDAISRS